jgi:hypothetical protein
MKFLFRMVFKQEDDLKPVFSNKALEYALRKVQENEKRMELNGNFSSSSMIMMLIC